MTLKIPDALDAKLRSALAKRNESFSDLAREIEEQEVDFAQLAAPYRGMMKGASDLSTREGYGNPHDR